MASLVLASVPPGCRGQCQSSIKQLLVKFIFMALVRPRPEHLFQPDSVATSCSTIGMKRTVMGGPQHCPKRTRDKQGDLIRVAGVGFFQEHTYGSFKEQFEFQTDCHLVNGLVCNICPKKRQKYLFKW